MIHNTLDRLTGKVKKIKFAVFDIEADKWTDFAGLGFYDGNDYKFFQSVADFLDYVLTDKYNKFVFFAHAGAHYDFSFILEELKKNSRGFKVKMAAGDTGIWNITVDKKEKWYNKKKKRREEKTVLKFVFSDSFRLLPVSLKQAGKDLGVQHAKMELPITKWSGKDKGYYVFRSSMSNVTKFDRWMEYLKFDCLCLYECIDKFYELVNAIGGNCKLTTASSSMDIFRRNFLETKIKTYRKHEQFFRLGYYGGRCEVFKLYGENLNYYDFNSLYPYIMNKYKMPIGSVYHDKSIDAPGFSLCRIKAGFRDLPILPYRLNGKLIFPIGRFSGWYDNELLRYAQSLGYEIEIESSLNFSEETHLFKEYVKEFYAIKEKAEREGHKALRFIAKMLLNSLYGKFGQRREVENLIINRGDYELKEGVKPYNEDFGLYLVKSVSRANFILPAIAAHVTAMAGMELHMKMKEAGDVYYCDTDSIVTSSELDTGTKLGELKLEHRIEKGYFMLPKIYAILTEDGKTIIKAKGFSQDLREKLSFNDIASMGKSCFKEKKEAFLSMRESIRRNDKIVSKAIIKKAIKKEYDKRRVLRDLSTEPLLINL